MIRSEIREFLASKRSSSSSSFLAASPHEQTTSVQDAVKSGFKAASIAGTATAVPTLVGCRVIPWAKANLNYTAQALIISAAAVAGFFIAADKSILGSTKENALKKYEKIN